MLTRVFFLFFLQVIDKSFGFDTAVEEAQRAINAAHVEATSCDNCIGLVKLMGRYSGKFHTTTWYSAVFVSGERVSRFHLATCTSLLYTTMRVHGKTWCSCKLYRAIV